MKPEDFWKRIQKPVDCWLYEGAKEANGYGWIANPFGDTPKHLTAHRLSWIFTHGSIPDGMQVLHKCDVRSCCNPDHLFLGTRSDNMRDKIRKGRDARYLSQDKIDQIRSMLGTMTQTQISKEMQVSRSVVNKIKLGKVYAWMRT